MTPAEYGDLADRLVPVAAGLACLVHGDGTSHDIAHVLNRLDEQQRIALIVVLAGLVDPDAALDDTFGYLDWDEYGRALPDKPKRASRAAVPPRTIRDIAITPTLPSPLLDFFREEQKVLARIKYRAGQRQDDIARDLGVDGRTIGRWVGTPKEAVA
jgi:hypothetical protein